MSTVCPAGEVVPIDWPGYILIGYVHCPCKVDQNVSINWHFSSLSLMPYPGSDVNCAMGKSLAGRWCVLCWFLSWSQWSTILHPLSCTSLWAPTLLKVITNFNVCGCHYLISHKGVDILGGSSSITFVFLQVALLLKCMGPCVQSPAEHRNDCDTITM
jgi:hypothetical protein